MAMRNVLEHCKVEVLLASASAEALSALREHKPVLVDLWAPWCHTCLSMKNFEMFMARA